VDGAHGYPSMKRGTCANEERLAIQGCLLVFSVLFIRYRYARLSTEVLEAEA